MGDSIKDLARKKMLEEKRMAKERLRQAGEVVKANALKEKIEKAKLNEARKAREAEKKALSKKIKDEILSVHYKNSKGNYVNEEKGIYIFKMADGNIAGKNGNGYFYSYQKNNVTNIKTFGQGEERTISDGDHYPTFTEVSTYNVVDVSINAFGSPVPSSLYKKVVQSEEVNYGSFKDNKEYYALKAIKESVEENIVRVNKGQEPTLIETESKDKNSSKDRR